jgi:hypothetical protein
MASSPGSSVSPLLDPPRARVFFIWLDPEAPLSAAASGESRAHPLPAAYAANVAAWGAAYGCAARVLDGAACLSAVAAVSAALGLRALEDEYRALAAGGRWVECVDVARLAVLWLGACDAGAAPASRAAPLLYVDTDTACGGDVLDARGGGGGDGGDAPPPLLLAPQDAEGNVQNCFLAVCAPRHPFLELALRAAVAVAATEPHPVRATGPALLTALLLAAGPARLLAGAAPATAPPRVPAQLPPSAPQASFPFLATVPRLAATVELVLHERGRGGARTLRETVHLLPPSALFPRHWRNEPAAAEPNCFGRAAPQPLFPRLRIPTDLASFLRAPAPPPAVAADAGASSGGDEARATAGAGGGSATQAAQPKDGAATPAAAAPATLRLGTHAWDCTWGGGRAAGGAYGYAAGYYVPPHAGASAAAPPPQPQTQLAAALRGWLAAVLPAWRAAHADADAAALRGDGRGGGGGGGGEDDGEEDSTAQLWDASQPPLSDVPPRHRAQRLRALGAGAAQLLHADDTFGAAGLAVRIVGGLAAQGVLALPAAPRAPPASPPPPPPAAAAAASASASAAVNRRHPTPFVLP